ncbi:unnamed protein product [Cochlearia groenlandica]
MLWLRSARQPFWFPDRAATSGLLGLSIFNVVSGQRRKAKESSTSVGSKAVEVQCVVVSDVKAKTCLLWLKS